MSKDSKKEPGKLVEDVKAAEELAYKTDYQETIRAASIGALALVGDAHQMGIPLEQYIDEVAIPENKRPYEAHNSFGVRSVAESAILLSKPVGEMITAGIRAGERVVPEGPVGVISHDDLERVTNEVVSIVAGVDSNLARIEHQDVLERLRDRSKPFVAAQPPLQQ